MFPTRKQCLNYIKKDLRHDLTAGIIVGLVALPLAIAFGIASGATAQQGLYTAIIAGLIVALLSGSSFQIAGPTGAFIVILLGVVNQFGLQNLLVAGFMAGILLLLMGVFRFGTVIKYIPYPVIVGFTAGIGTIIASGQIKDFLGLSFDHRPHGFIDTILSTANGIQQGINPYALIVGAITLLSFFLWKRFTDKFPPAPIALIAGILASLFFSGKIATVGDIPSGLPAFGMIDLSFSTIEMLLPAAFTIALLGAIESLLSAVVADGMSGTKHDSNKELIAQGIANMTVPFFGGIPATGAIARTATNIKSGARTRIAGVIHAITLILIILVFAPYAKFIPMAALAGILLIVAYMMSDIPHFVKMFQAPREDIIVLLLTYILTVFVDLTLAVGIGVVFAALLFVKRIGEIQVTKGILQEERDQQLHELVKDTPQIILYDINGPLFFGAASLLQDRIIHNKNEILIIRMKHVHVIDVTALHALELIIQSVHKKKGRVFLSTVQHTVEKALDEHGIIHHLGGADYVTKSSEDAIAKAKRLLAKGL